MMMGYRPSIPGAKRETSNVINGISANKREEHMYADKKVFSNPHNIDRCYVYW